MGFTQPIFLVFLLCFSTGLLALEWRARHAREGRSAEAGRVRTHYIAYASLVFYGIWYPPGIVLLLLHGVLLWWTSSAIARRDRRVQALAVGLSLGTLGLFKYYDFFLGLIWPGAPTLGLFLPLGISFYTFTVVGYYVDLGRGDAEPASDFAEGLLLIAFWPHLAAGPILRARDVIRRGARSPALSAETWALSLTMIAAGLVRKLLIADNIGAYVNHNVDQGIWGMGTLEAWAVVLGFGAQIYADFSGYSDMAIGFALLLGYRLPANFNFPYRATSMREFWRRWHISLSSWFRDYLYIPLGGGRGARGRVVLVLMIVFLISGLWHGAAVGFVVWGAIHGGFVVVERLLGRHYLRVPAPFRWVSTMLGVFVAWGFFRLDGARAWDLTRKLFGWAPVETLADSFAYVSPYYVAPIFLFLALVVVDHVFPSYEVDEQGYPMRARGRVWLAALAILLPCALLFSGDPLPFIYFDF